MKNHFSSNQTIAPVIPNILLALLLSVMLISCSSSTGSSDSTTNTNTVETNTTGTDSVGPIDISQKILTERHFNCSTYVSKYTSMVNDVGNNVSFDGNLAITVSNGKCTFSSNAIPNHDFNVNGNFATEATAQEQIFSITSSPTMAASVTNISLSYDNAVFLNGVKLDLLAAGCYDVGNGKIGCNDMNQPFRSDPMGTANGFGTDDNNAHTQPDGTYHYHGDPNALFTNNATPSTDSPVIGFAADGFPIYGSYFMDGNSVIRKAKSSYRLKSGTRSSVTFGGTDYSPGGNYDGTYVDDYEYVADSGDLDECNGMMYNNQYGYYVTDSFPWVMKCFKGTPDSSFQKGGGTGGGPPPRP